MNALQIGQYIQFLRKQKQMSQKDIAAQLHISFQAVSKWENGETLPDVSLLLDLADLLDTSVDKILSGGSLLNRKSKMIAIDDIKQGFNALEDMRVFFGEKSTFYQGAIEGINAKMNIDIEAYLNDSHSRECMLAEAIVQYLLNGYTVDPEDIDLHIQAEKMRATIKKYMR